MLRYLKITMCGDTTLINTQLSAQAFLRDLRIAKMQSLLASYNRSCATMMRTCTAQERATAASLRVSWILAKKKRPFTDSETVKECMLAVVNEVINDDKVKTSVTSIKNVPLSDT